MIKKHRIFHLLINNAYKKLNQSTVSTTCNCLPVYTCKVLKKLIGKKILTKPSRNALIMGKPLLLSFILGYEKKFATPLLFKTPNFKNTIEVLNSTMYSLTLDSAISVKSGNKPNLLQAYVLGRDIGILMDKFTPTKKNPDLIVYPSDHFKFLHQQLLDNVVLASDWDIIIDLIAKSKVNKALRFAKKYKIVKELV